MPQSLVQNYIHIVFSTKGRAPFLREPDLRNEMHAYLGGTCHHLDSPALIVGGVHDHVHIVCRLSSSLELMNLIKELKVESSKWIKTKHPTMGDFHWQAGYGGFSVSPSHLAQLTNYVKNQEEHHRTESFQDEYRRLLRKYNIPYDERYVWD